MNQLITKLMKLVNDAIIEGKLVNKDVLAAKVVDSNVDQAHKIDVLRIIETTHLPTLLNKKLFDYNDKLEQARKHAKKQRKFKNQEPNEQLAKDFFQFEDYVYSIISTPDYKSKMSKTKEKVRLLDIHNMYGYGHDKKGCTEDVVSEGRAAIWEGLKKYGVLPEKDKKFGGVTRERTIAGKSTFVFTNLKRHMINLGTKASSKKFNAPTVEFKPEILEGPNNDD